MYFVQMQFVSVKDSISFKIYSIIVWGMWYLKILAKMHGIKPDKGTEWNNNVCSVCVLMWVSERDREHTCWVDLLMYEIRALMYICDARKR